MSRKHPPVDERLQQVPLFAGLSKKHLREVGSLATMVDRPAGSVLAKEGQPGHEFFVVLEGEVEVKRGDEVIATRGPGTALGEIALLDDRPRTASLVAKTPVLVDVIGQREFKTLLNDVPEVAAALKQTMADRLKELEASDDHH